jgi:hypothetical protein
VNNAFMLSKLFSHNKEPDGDQKHTFSHFSPPEKEFSYHKEHDENVSSSQALFRIDG